LTHSRFRRIGAAFLFPAETSADHHGDLKFMANTASAKKAIRKIAARTAVNQARRSRMRTFVRRVVEALAKGDAAAAKAALVDAQPEIMRAVSKGVVHKNTGSRKVSRLAQRIKALDGG